MSASKISYLQKITNGMVFSEDFEDDNFISRSGWNLVQGTPTTGTGAPLTSTDQAKTGIKSLKMAGAADLSGLPPILEQTITYTNFNSTGCGVWFYDDLTTNLFQTQAITPNSAPTTGTVIFVFNGHNSAAINWNDSTSTLLSKIQAITGIGSGNVVVSGTLATQVTVQFIGSLAGANQPLFTFISNTLSAGTARVFLTAAQTVSAYPGPYFKVKLSSGDFLQVGVRNAVSSTNYSAGWGTEDSFSATSVARTAGWHFFSMGTNAQAHPAGFDIAIDGTGVGGVFPTPTNQVANIYIQGGVASVPSDSFGYFDFVQLMRDNTLWINGTEALSAMIMDRNGNKITDVLPWTFSSAGEEAQDYFVTLTDAYNSPCVINQTLLPQVVGGDIYQLTVIDFGRKVTALTDNQKSILSNNVSMAGQSETQVTGLTNNVSISLKALQTRDVYAQLRSFYAYARQGGPFSLSVDGGDSASAFVTNPPDGSGLPPMNWTGNFNSGFLLYIWSPIDYIKASSFFTVGNYYVLENAAHTKREVVQLGSITDDNTPTQGLGVVGVVFGLNGGNFNLNPGDRLRSLFFYPSLQLQNPAASSLKLTDPRNFIFDWTENFMEYVNP